MINKFPLWKNLLVIAIVLFGIIYSIPNLFGEDPAIQINATKGASVTQGDADRVLVNGKPQRASYNVKQGDILEIQLGSKAFKAEILQINEYAKKEDAPLMYRTIE